MSNKNKYLIAARDVLMRSGKPMHYETITKVALDLGLLETENHTPAIAMSSILNYEIAKNPLSVFKKYRPGVFGFIPGIRFGREIATYKNLGKRVNMLISILGLRTSMAVIRRALFLLRRAMDITGSDMKIAVGNEKQSIEIRLKSYNKIRNSIYDLCSKKARNTKHDDKIHINRSICIFADQLKTRVGLSNIFEVIDLGVLLLEASAGILINGNIIIKGQNGLETLRIRSPKKAHG